MNNRIERRTFLKGVGTALALPMLEVMAPTTALAQSVKAQPVRMAFAFVPNGINMDKWTPAAAGKLEITPILEPLRELRGSLNVISGLAQNNAAALGDGPGDHARSTATWLTGVHCKKTAGADIHNGISADQVAAQAIGGNTRFPSLEIGCERSGLNGDCDSGYSCAYSSNISWRSATTPVAKEVNPRQVFERLFGNGQTVEAMESRAKRAQYDRSILDFVAEDADALRGRLGKHDQMKLEEYLQSVREVEQRLTRIEKESKQVSAPAEVKMPVGVPQDRGEHIRLMGDMMVLAFQADLTRICTFMLANDGSNRPYREIGISEGHHDISHHGDDPGKLAKKAEIDTFHVAQMAYVLKKMQGIQELDGRTLLDNTVLVYGAGISDGNRHNHDHLPVLVAGRGGGRLAAGRHLVVPEQTPMNNLFLSMLDFVGVKVETLGDSTGKLQGIF
ncbi:MAG: DUF1552 domain-containing protein [Fimbriimonadaceae bacterium]|nr:DUF1552 domain-containing protein [Fimbriimonadaceae bacterium]